ncbi:MAG: VacJ family lipoprotein [Pseudomonadota bacterium]
MTQSKCRRRRRAPSLLLGLSLALSTAVGATPENGEGDPLESINRGVFAFNDTTDRWLLRPLADTYTDLAPSFVRRGVSNALRNLRDVNYAINALFQGRWDDAAANASRFAFNSTLGLAGTIDVATAGGIDSSYADFGQTLATWGMPSGPFIMIPIIGPSTLRDGAGFGVDAAVLSVPAHIESTEVSAAIWGTAVVHTRSQLLGMDDLVTGDRYIFMRDAYLQRRRVTLGEDVELDNFGDFGDFEDDLSEEF